MKIKTLSALLFCILSAPVIANPVTVTVNLSGESKVYTLQSMSVGSDGSVVVNASDDGGASPGPGTYTLSASASPAAGGSVLVNGVAASGTQAISAGTSVSLTYQLNSGYTFSGWSFAGCGTAATCNFTLNSNLTGTANFALASSGGGGGTQSCPASSGSLKIECTNLPTPITETTRNPNPNDVVVFRIGPFTQAHVGSIRAVVTTSNLAGKHMSITDTPGFPGADSPLGRACSVAGAEAATISYAVDRADLSARSYCLLQSNKYYYVNVVDRFYPKPYCTTTTNCGFKFTAN